VLSFEDWKKITDHETRGDMVHDILAAWEEERKSHKWQSMETAPKNGIPVLLWCREDGIDDYTVIANWRTENFITKAGKRKTWVVQYTYQDEQGGEMTIENPVAWMLLPILYNV